MSPEFDLKQPGDDHIKRQKMLNALGDAIASEDFDFMVTIAEGQEFLRPFELAEYLNVKRENCEEPEDQENWKQGLERYLETLEGQEFPEEEKEVIDQVIFSLQTENMSELEAPEPEILEEAGEAEYPDFEIEQDVDNWDSEVFTPLITEDEREDAIRLSQTSFFAELEKLACKNVYGGVQIKTAVDKIKEQAATGEAQDLLRKMIDSFIYQEAERLAEKNVYGGAQLGSARKLIGLYASSDEAAAYLDSSIDKHVFAEAERLAEKNVYGPPNPRKAKEVIEQYASTEERCDAMLRRLGFA